MLVNRQYKRLGAYVAKRRTEVAHRAIEPGPIPICRVVMRALEEADQVGGLTIGRGWDGRVGGDPGFPLDRIAVGFLSCIWLFSVRKAGIEARVFIAKIRQHMSRFMGEEF